jgi:hypothetical protein
MTREEIDLYVLEYVIDEHTVYPHIVCFSDGTAALLTLGKNGKVRIEYIDTVTTVNTDSETCFECGDSVKFGSGKFVNRVPNLDDFETRVDMGTPNPFGEWLCQDCNDGI